MPQMAPMSWVMLFSMFIIMMMMITATNYYLYTPTMKKSTMMLNIKKKMSWSW